MLKFTRHAEGRLRRRGWSEYMVDIALAYGRVENAPGGATRIFFGKKEAQDMFQEIKAFTKMVSKTTGGTLILKDNCIITAYKRG